MSKWAALAGSNTAMVVSAGAVAVAAVGAGVYINSRSASEPDVVVQQAAAPAPKTTAFPEVDTPEVDTPEVDTPEIDKPETAPEEIAKTGETALPPETPPSIDEVRVEADGLTVVAGRALPGSKVSVFLDGVENTSVTTDAGGGFAAITMIGPKSTAQVLTIVQRIGDKALPSLEEIILAPSSAPAGVAQGDAEIAPDAETDTGTDTPPALSVAVARQDAPVGVAEAAPDVEPVSEPDVVEIAPAARDAGESVTDAKPAPDEDTAATTDATSIPDKPLENTGDTIAKRAEDPAQTAQPAQDVAQTPEQSVAQTDGAQADGAQAPATGTEASPDADQPAQPLVVANPTAESDPAVDVADSVPDAPTAPQKITILKSTSDGVEVLSSGPAALDAIAIDTISYSDEGDVQLAGRAQSAADIVRVYVNNRPVTELSVDPDGRWRGDLPDVDTGVYTLRVDEVDAAGDVTSRVETPFKREDPQVLAEADTTTSAAKQITVQTGATLWAIARDRYGEGLLYVQVFEANRDAIRDPDLIYPGQVFALPD